MKKDFFLLIAMLFMLLSSCASTDQGRQISAEDAWDLMKEDAALVVDVRRADEYAAGHIPGAILLPNESIADQRPAELPDVNAAIIVYCRTGVRSKEAAQKLVAMGYANVADLGGIVDWPYDVVVGEAPESPFN